ncbi:hypothetical protein TBLA_0F03280 [Henningerozyma blattae CBS 6284]|uniref:RING-type domain-containing protein n=1 Tax=Henningerozyma blattae (strain ATCC 34711 / CBS 6284 / DSM 70876 / NBRC 10599 / NRRL Y-10934 / UCD 77-7) TaxID=1071380 RepID=I2H664_HENB6|nr:hypothetical protein TBLA_0F03280 [Tetrapisispora blattae CBS 6284]CCH61866.1 hypothetical protein TBLA_0F03280 [Tetrapisispora blattae CBS 6284]
MIQNCPICLEDITDILGSLKVCQHNFHFNCIRQWHLTSKSLECPVCRRVSNIVIQKTLYKDPNGLPLDGGLRESSDIFEFNISTGAEASIIEEYLPQSILYNSLSSTGFFGEDNQGSSSNYNQSSYNSPQPSSLHHLIQEDIDEFHSNTEEDEYCDCVYCTICGVEGEANDIFDQCPQCNRRYHESCLHSLATEIGDLENWRDCLNCQTTVLTITQPRFTRTLLSNDIYIDNFSIEESNSDNFSTPERINSSSTSVDLSELSPIPSITQAVQSVASYDINHSECLCSESKQQSELKQFNNHKSKEKLKAPLIVECNSTNNIGKMCCPSKLVGSSNNQEITTVTTAMQALTITEETENANDDTSLQNDFSITNNSFERRIQHPGTLRSYIIDQDKNPMNNRPLSNKNTEKKIIKNPCTFDHSHGKYEANLHLSNNTINSETSSHVHTDKKTKNNASPLQSSSQSQTLTDRIKIEAVERDTKFKIQSHVRKVLDPYYKNGVQGKKLSKEIYTMINRSVSRKLYVISDLNYDNKLHNFDYLAKVEILKEFEAIPEFIN